MPAAKGALRMKGAQFLTDGCGNPNYRLTAAHYCGGGKTRR